MLWRCVRVHKEAGEKHGGKNTPLREYFVSAAPELPSKRGTLRTIVRRVLGTGKRGARATLETGETSPNIRGGFRISAAPELPSKLIFAGHTPHDTGPPVAPCILLTLTY